MFDEFPLKHFEVKKPVLSIIHLCLLTFGYKQINTNRAKRLCLSFSLIDFRPSNWINLQGKHPWGKGNQDEMGTEGFLPPSTPLMSEES